MNTEMTITVLPQEEGDVRRIEKRLAAQLAEKNISAEGKTFALVKRSVDARHGRVKIRLRYAVRDAQTEADSCASFLPLWKAADGNKRALIIGSGPAGLFGAFKLLEHGIKPVILERGEETAERKRSIAAISTRGMLNPDSNYCFGEGGAGTFSDGKLFTRSNKRGDVGKILQIFVHFGAHPAILTDAHPHIGTDRLPLIINAMKREIIRLGGEFHFNTRCTELLTDGGRVWGVKAQNVRTGERTEFSADAVLLAAGHSADDVYKMIACVAPAALEAKTFAAGVRIEHPRSLIDAIQYHRAAGSALGAAEYRLTAQVNGRGVYTFCMCPGGFVVPASTEDDGIVVNGMSAASRNSKWSNAAVVVELRPEDVPESFKTQADADGCSVLAGLYFRKHIERLTKLHGSAQKAPAQLMTDFLAARSSDALIPSSYTPGLAPSRLDNWLPPHIAERIAAALPIFDTSMRGYISPQALLIASETRTSTPVRILRNKDTLECIALGALYPAGECSGYSGGIVSSAMDGEKAAAAIARVLTEPACAR